MLNQFNYQIKCLKKHFGVFSYNSSKDFRQVMLQENIMLLSFCLGRMAFAFLRHNNGMRKSYCIHVIPITDFKKQPRQIHINENVWDCRLLVLERTDHCIYSDHPQFICGGRYVIMRIEFSNICVFVYVFVGHSIIWVQILLSYISYKGGSASGVDI